MISPPTQQQEAILRHLREVGATNAEINDALGMRRPDRWLAWCRMLGLPVRRTSPRHDDSRPHVSRVPIKDRPGYVKPPRSKRSAKFTLPGVEQTVVMPETYRTIGGRMSPMSQNGHRPAAPGATLAPIGNETMAPPRIGRARECCWPLGEPGTRAFHFCGDQVQSGKPYCPAHCAVAYVPTPRQVGREAVA